MNRVIVANSKNIKRTHPAMGVRLAFFFHPVNQSHGGLTIMASIYQINIALKNAIKLIAAESKNCRAFSRKSALSCETIIRLLIGSEGGSLDEILHAAGISHCIRYHSASRSNRSRCVPCCL